jgi:hypothetical protein
MANTQTIFDYKIHPVVSDLIIRNEFLTKVYNPASEYYENPIVLYSTDANANNLLSLSLNKTSGLTHQLHLYADITDNMNRDKILRNLVFLERLKIDKAPGTDADKAPGTDADKAPGTDADSTQFDSFHYVNSHNKITWRVKSKNNIEQMKFL